ncbi:hypothetical protein BDN70DRAFT_977314, partial [Pholiota conissans]
MNTALPFEEHILRADTVQSIDKAIQRHQEHILSLRRRRNGLIPISILPPEIFCAIFMIVRTNCAKMDSKTDKRAWVELTHVCSHWRSIAISSPTLWALIDSSLLHDADRLYEVLRRSKEPPL